MEEILLLMLLPGLGLRGVKDIIALGKVESTLGEVQNYSYYKAWVDKIMADCLNLGVTPILNSFKNIPDSPLILFLKGNQLLLEEDKTLGVVGTRTPRDLGQEVTRIFTKHAIENQFNIVSGLALGCDTIALKETIKSGVGGIGVIPQGFERNKYDWFLKNNKNLIVSEYPPYTPTKKFRCVRRNRIIAGFSKVIFVPETKPGGGSLHTVKYANEIDLPIGYTLGFTGIEELGAIKIDSLGEFDQFIKKSLQ